MTPVQNLVIVILDFIKPFVFYHYSLFPLQIFTDDDITKAVRKIVSYTFDTVDDLTNSRSQETPIPPVHKKDEENQLGHISPTYLRTLLRYQRSEQRIALCSFCEIGLDRVLFTRVDSLEHCMYRRLNL